VGPYIWSGPICFHTIFPTIRSPPPFVCQRVGPKLRKLPCESPSISHRFRPTLFFHFLPWGYLSFSYCLIFRRKFPPGLLPIRSGCSQIQFRLVLSFSRPKTGQELSNAFMSALSRRHCVASGAVYHQMLHNSSTSLLRLVLSC